jgi:hypothetical protein
MPHGETFWNPYRLVPIREKIPRQAPLTDEKFSGRSGIITCTLENLTLLFVGKNRSDPSSFLKRNGHCVIPGTSIKGMIRSLAELVGGGCFATNPKGRHDQYRQLDDHFKACSHINSLCIACRLFGMMERGSGARVHKGKVSISDALIQEAQPQARQLEVLLNTPKISHTPFYKTPTTNRFDAKSRKLYFHQPQRTETVLPIPENLRPRAQKIKALLPGHHFNFTVQFANLLDEELELLLYVLALEEEVGVKVGQDKNQISLRGPLRHKIGYGKPVGLGSCHLMITSLTYLDSPRHRFASLESSQGITLEELLHTEISERTRRFKNDQSPTMQDLRKIMVWDPSDPRTFRYPGYYWFQNQANKGTELKRI